MRPCARPTLALFALGLLGCSASRSGVSGPSGSAVASTSASPVTTPLAGPPVLVIQTTDLHLERPGYPERWRGVDLSPDGTLVAAWGPSLKLISRADGTVRAHFPGCVFTAAFEPSGRAMTVVGCQTCPGPDGSTPEAPILRWDLDDGSVKELARGPYSAVSFTDDDASAILRGKHGALLVSLATGATRSVFAVRNGDDELLDVASTGDRATSGRSTQVVMLTEKGASRPFHAWEAALSPDMRRYARWGDNKRIVIEEPFTGDLIVEAYVPHAKAIDGFGPEGVLAVTIHHDGKDVVALVDPSGKSKCSIARAGRLGWSNDGKTLSVDTRIDVGTDGSDWRRDLAFYDMATCARIGEPLRLGEQDSLVATNGSGARVYLAVETGRSDAFYVVGRGDTTLTRIDVRRPLDLDRTSGAEPAAFSVGREGQAPLGFDPRTVRTFTTPEAPAITSSTGTLSVVVGNIATPLRGAVPVGASGPIVWVDASGKRTPLAKSDSFASAPEAWMTPGCRPSERGALVVCERYGDGVPSTIGIWDATGKQRWVGPGIAATFSDDGTRAIVHAPHSGIDVLVDVTTGKPLLEGIAQGAPAATFNRSRTLIAWERIGIVDAATGKAIQTAHTSFAGWASDDRALVIRNTATMRRQLEGSAPGPIDVRDARSGALVKSLDDDAELLDVSVDGARLLTRDAVDVLRVRDASTFAELARIDGYERGWLTPDGAYVVAKGNDAILLHRIADGAQLFEIPSSNPGDVGLVFTASGLYDLPADAPAAMFDLVKFRVGSARTGNLVAASDGPPGARRSGLAADFFAGRSITVTP